MQAFLNDDRYTVISSSNTSTTMSYNLYPEFEVLSDLDQNGINDAWELPLAEKFCPNLTLPSDDQGVRLVPVEIMDRNGDGELDWQDVIVDVYSMDGDPIFGNEDTDYIVVGGIITWVLDDGIGD